jgi:hypothetical protein
MSRAHRILTEQPKNPAQLELHDSPLTRGLASVFLDGYDVVLRKPFEIFTADLTKSFGRYGPQFTTAQAGTSAPYDTRFSYLGSGYTGPITISALCRLENALSNGLFGIGDNDGNTGAGLGIKTSTSGSAYIRALIYINSGATLVTAVSAIVPDNAYHTVTATWDGSNVITLYLDGEIIASATGATGCYLPESFTIGAFGAGGGSGDIALATYHKRCLSAPEVRSLSRRPWQIFSAPDKRSWPKSLTVTTIAAVTADAIGAVVSTSTSVTTLDAVTADAIGSVASTSTSITTLDAVTSDAIGSVASTSTSVTTLDAVTADAIGAIASASTSVTTLDAVTADATGSVASTSTSVTTISAVTADVRGSVVSSPPNSVTTISAVTADAIGSVASTSTSVTTLDAVTADAIGSVASTSTSVTTLDAVTADAIGAVVSLSAIVTAINAVTANAIGSVVSLSTSITTLNAVTANALGHVLSRGVPSLVRIILSSEINTRMMLISGLNKKIVLSSTIHTE